MALDPGFSALKLRSCSGLRSHRSPPGASSPLLRWGLHPWQSWGQECRCPRSSHSQSRQFSHTLHQNRFVLRCRSQPIGLCWRQGGSNFFRQLRYFLQSSSVTSLQIFLLWMVFCWLRTGCDEGFRIPLARRAGAGGDLQAKPRPQPAARQSK